MKLLKAICAGLNDPRALLDLIDHNRLKASTEDLLSSIKEDYREHMVNTLSCSLNMYEFLKDQMRIYEGYIEKTLV